MSGRPCLLRGDSPRGGVLLGLGPPPTDGGAAVRPAAEAVRRRLRSRATPGGRHAAVVVRRPAARGATGAAGRLAHVSWEGRVIDTRAGTVREHSDRTQLNGRRVL